MPLSILLAVAHPPGRRDELARQLAADGHVVARAQHARHAASLLAGRRFDMLILGALEPVSAAPALLRDLRAGRLDARAWPELPTITLAPLVSDDELDAVRAYEAGSDHHVPSGAGYVHQRAVLAAVARRARGAGGRVRRVGAIEVDTLAREVCVGGARVVLSAMEYSLLAMLVSEPRRVFTKRELLRDVWGYETARRSRTLDAHACRLRRKLSQHGAHAVINVWGVGYCLVQGPAVRDDAA